MGVKSVKENFKQRRASYSGGIMTHTKQYLIECTDTADDTATVEAALPFQPGTAWRGYPLSRIDITPTQNSSKHFDAIVEFSSREVDSNLSINPLARPSEVSYSFTEGSEAYFTDNAPTPKNVLNSVGDKFANDPQRERSDLIITCEQNEANYDVVRADAFSHTVNTDLIRIDTTVYSPGTLKLSPITAVKQVEAWFDGVRTINITFYKKTYVFKARNPDRWGPNPWRDHFLDRGMYEQFNDTDPKTGQAITSRRPIYDSNNLPVTEPIWPLASGHALSSKDSVPDTLEFYPYKEVAFGPLLIRPTAKATPTV